jgi:hypothetical protein
MHFFAQLWRDDIDLEDGLKIVGCATLKEAAEKLVRSSKKRVKGSVEKDCHEDLMNFLKKLLERFSHGMFDFCF